jgi:drug/metabolite transporter (DMT)-like permease
MVALALGLTAALCWAVHDLFVRKLSQGTELVPLMVAVLAAGSVALVVPVLIWGEWGLMTGPAVWLALAAGVAFAVAFGSLYKAFSLAPVRVVSPIIGAYPMMSLGLAVAQGRPVTAGDWLAVTAIVGGIAVVALTGDDEKPGPQARTGQAMAWAALSACGFAVTFALGQAAARTGSELPAILITRIAALICVALLLLLRRSKPQPIGRQWKVMAAMGVLDAIALGAVMLSGSLPHAEYASVASALFGVLTILLATQFLNERVRPVQWLGIAVIFAGIGKLAV